MHIAIAALLFRLCKTVKTYLHLKIRRDIWEKNILKADAAVDFARMSAVCKSWRFIIKENINDIPALQLDFHGWWFQLIRMIRTAKV